jgi:hypothetical protein
MWVTQRRMRGEQQWEEEAVREDGKGVEMVWWWQVGRGRVRWAFLCLRLLRQFWQRGRRGRRVQLHPEGLMSKDTHGWASYYKITPAPHVVLPQS